MLNLAPDISSNNTTLLIKTMRRLLNNRQELDRLIIQARENLRMSYGTGSVDSIPIVRLEIEIIRLSIEKTYPKNIVEEADTMLGDRFRNRVYKIEKEYCARKNSLKKSQQAYGNLSENQDNKLS